MYPWIITPVMTTRTEDPPMEGHPTFATASRKVVSTIIYYPALSLENSLSGLEIVPLQENPECLREKRGYIVSYLAFAFPKILPPLLPTAYDDPFALPSFIILISVRNISTLFEQGDIHYRFLPLLHFGLKQDPS